MVLSMNGCLPREAIGTWGVVQGYRPPFFDGNFAPWQTGGVGHRADGGGRNTWPHLLTCKLPWTNYPRILQRER